MNIAVIYILISVLGSAIGQVLLKKGMNSMGPLTMTPGAVPSLLWKMGTNPYVVTGLGIYFLGTIFWLTALSRVNLSFAYPFASLSYVLMLLASWWLFHETITPLRVAGALVIIGGVLLIART
jgi:drug/metabolite transporter (DMT)-like permease